MIPEINSSGPTREDQIEAKMNALKAQLAGTIAGEIAKEVVAIQGPDSIPEGRETGELIAAIAISTAQTIVETYRPKTAWIVN